MKWEWWFLNRVWGCDGVIILCLWGWRCGVGESWMSCLCVLGSSFLEVNIVCLTRFGRLLRSVWYSVYFLRFWKKVWFCRIALWSRKIVVLNSSSYTGCLEHCFQKIELKSNRSSYEKLNQGYQSTVLVKKSLDFPFKSFKTPWEGKPSSPSCLHGSRINSEKWRIAFTTVESVYRNSYLAGGDKRTSICGSACHPVLSSSPCIFEGPMPRTRSRKTVTAGKRQ